MCLAHHCSSRGAEHSRQLLQESVRNACSSASVVFAKAMLMT
jgi:hypothetical protein